MWLACQESKGNTGGWTQKLALYKKGRNSARDFFKQTKLPLESDHNYCLC